MSDKSITTHVLDKTNYSKHCTLSIPQESLAPLAPSSIRFCTRLISLTTNNLTYARRGHLMGWYDVYPLPSNTPAPYNDSERYGRIAAWGYADVVESSVPSISPGQTIFGFLPISTGLETIHVSYDSHGGHAVRDQIIALDAHRQHLWKLYNRYQVCDSLSDLERGCGLDALGWDALLRPAFWTSYTLNAYGFAWAEENRIHPSGKGDWSTEDADLRGAAVVILNASGKTAMAFAYALRSNRSSEYQPKYIIGVGSPASVDMIGNSGLYDRVVLNADDIEMRAFIEASGSRRTVLLDFGARPGAVTSWKSTLSSSHVPFTRITVAGEVKVQDPEAEKKRAGEMAALNLLNTNAVREKAIAVDGQRFFDDVAKAFEKFKESINGMQVQWGEGMEGWQQGWEAFCRDEVRADTGLVYRI